MVVSDPPSNTWFLWPNRISQLFFAGHIYVTNTDGQTLLLVTLLLLLLLLAMNKIKVALSRYCCRTTLTSVAVSHICAMHAMQPKNWCWQLISHIRDKYSCSTSYWKTGEHLCMHPVCTDFMKYGCKRIQPAAPVSSCVAELVNSVLCFHVCHW